MAAIHNLIVTLPLITTISLLNTTVLFYCHRGLLFLVSIYVLLSTQSVIRVLVLTR